MPNYTAVNKKTGKEETLYMTIREMEEYVRKNPDWEILCGAPLIHSGFMKTSSGWKDVLKTIKKSHPGSTIKVR
jgi:hypothetical protein